jgi:gamma-glutamyl-gamma-aminobutyrate hydrolase PuuD
MVIKIAWINLGDGHRIHDISSLLAKHTDESIVVERAFVELPDISGIIITGDQADLMEPNSIWDSDIISFVKSGLSADMPVLATGYGMGFLNLCFGGGYLSPTENHRVESMSYTHRVYISPGSKSAAILGVGGFFSLNSRHKLGLKESQRSPRLLASAYSVDDGVVEGIESTEQSWVIGFQANLESCVENPKVFGNLFIGFVERVVNFHKLHYKS